MRLSGLAAGIATFAVLEITQNIVRNWEKIGPGPLTLSTVPETTDLWQATAGAIAVALTFAFFKLFLETQAPPGYMKQNLATLRIVSFAAVAWIVARAVHAGWVGKLAHKLPVRVVHGIAAAIFAALGVATLLGAGEALGV